MTCLHILCQVTFVPFVKSFIRSVLTLSSDRELYFLMEMQTVLTTQSTACISATKGTMFRPGNECMGNIIVSE